MENIGTLILAAGALGTASFGIVETLKWTRIGEFGFGMILVVLGPIMQALEVAFGTKFEDVLRAQYQGGQNELARTIRQGVRAGLTEKNALEMAKFLGVVEGDQLSQVATLLQSGEELSSELRNVLGRFELAVDARIDAALTLAQNRYVGLIRITAAIVALAIALSIGLALFIIDQDPSVFYRALVVGLIAVPVAPVAKDLVTVLQSVNSAIRGRR